MVSEPGYLVSRSRPWKNLEGVDSKRSRNSTNPNLNPRKKDDEGRDLPRFCLTAGGTAGVREDRAC